MSWTNTVLFLNTSLIDLFESCYPSVLTQDTNRTMQRSLWCKMILLQLVWKRAQYANRESSWTFAFINDTSHSWTEEWIHDTRYVSFECSLNECEKYYCHSPSYFEIKSTLLFLPNSKTRQIDREEDIDKFLLHWRKRQTDRANERQRQRQRDFRAPIIIFKYVRVCLDVIERRSLLVFTNSFFFF